MSPYRRECAAAPERGGQSGHVSAPRPNRADSAPKGTDARREKPHRPGAGLSLGFTGVVDVREVSLKECQLVILDENTQHDRMSLGVFWQLQNQLFTLLYGHLQLFNVGSHNRTLKQISGSISELQMMRMRKRLKFRKKQLQKGLVGHVRMRMRWRKNGPQQTMKTPSRMVRVMAPFMLVDWRLFLLKAMMRRECTCARRNMCRYSTALNTRVVKKKVTRHTMTALSVWYTMKRMLEAMLASHTTTMIMTARCVVMMLW
ncbi:hypothetical protein EYF80_014864 [Liparis tanakae]|uniref:Uncharacterized protein n=1 Tax=Liparis tanakae TaxID=230148 RepID=A0A4Z2IA88_9TELE|nr:hypothetical protein EYF80_014864 [Liparis tanakae]